MIYEIFITHIKHTYFDFCKFKFFFLTTSVNGFPQIDHCKIKNKKIFVLLL